MKIAVYTIAKNEEQFVERWAESAKDADYRFILDTGSTDKTISKARKAGVKVASATISPWRFDDARNAALALLPADTDMCIALDMDEVLLPGWRKELEKIADSTTRPRYTYTWSWKENGEPDVQYSADKIHRRHGYRWKHPVHEVVIPDRIQEVQERVNLEIHHYPDPTKSRGQYLPLLELAVREDPYNDRNAYYYARELFFYGKIDEAIKEFKRHLDLPTAKWGPERAASNRYLAKCQPMFADQYLLEAISAAPGRREALVELAQFYYDNEQWGWCKDYSVEAIAIKQKPLDYLCEDFAWGALPYDLAAISSWRLGDVEEAIQYTEKALEYEPDNQRLASNLTFYKAK